MVTIEVRGLRVVAGARRRTMLVEGMQDGGRQMLQLQVVGPFNRPVITFISSKNRKGSLEPGG